MTVANAVVIAAGVSVMFTYAAWEYGGESVVAGIVRRFVRAVSFGSIKIPAHGEADSMTTAGALIASLVILSIAVLIG